MNSIVKDYQGAAQDLSQSLARLLSELTKDYNQRVLNYLHEKGYHDIRQSHSAVFGNLGADAVRVTELAERARVTQQAMGKMLKELERMGYVKRAVDARDRRAKAIKLTSLGNNLIHDQLAAVNTIREAYSNLAGTHNISQLEQSLQSVLCKLELSNMPENWI